MPNHHRIFASGTEGFSRALFVSQVAGMNLVSIGVNLNASKESTLGI